MTDDSRMQNGVSAPDESRQESPRKARRTAGVIYSLLGNTIISALILTFAVMVFTKNAKDVRVGKELARDGHLAYTADVQSGGMHLATVYYSFINNGITYRGEAMLPHRFLNKINDYSKAGSFPVLFLPRDPSINHPYDWHDDQKYSAAFISYLMIAIVIVQWTMLIRFILRRQKGV
jgi:hypothetical protein